MVRPRLYRFLYLIYDRTRFCVCTGDVTVEPGSYSYNFHCNLPTNLPSSLEAQNGHIRYTVRVVLDRPILHMNQQFAKLVTVIKPLDLNAEPALQVRYWFLFC